MFSLRVSVIWAAAMVFAALWAPVAFGASASKPVLKVNGVVFNQFQLSEAMNQLLPAASFHGTVSEETLAAYRPKAIDMLIESELLYEEARRLGIHPELGAVDTAEQKTIDRVRSMKSYFGSLSAAGLTRDQYVENLRRRLTVEAFEAQEFKAKSAVTDAEVKAEYESHRAAYKRPESRRMSNILIAVDPSLSAGEVALRKKRAEEVLAKLKKGGDFGQLAWDYSDDPYRVKGGELGIVHKGRLDPDLEKVAFALKAGEISPLVRTIYGFHIVRVEEIIEPAQLTLDEVAAGIKARMEADRQKELRESTLKRLRDKAVIEEY